MKTIPFILTALLAIWLSASGTEPILLAIVSTGAMLLSLLIVSFLPWSFRKSVTSQRQRIGWLTICLCTLLYISAVATQWPLRVTFALSRPYLEQMVTSLRAGTRFQGPQRVGFFIIQEANVNNYPTTVCLWTALGPDGNTGFVEGPADVIQSPWFQIRLNKRWRLLSED